jgi:outer membrane receptor protein involved in Fe transport
MKNYPCRLIQNLTPQEANWRFVSSEKIMRALAYKTKLCVWACLFVFTFRLSAQTNPTPPGETDNNKSSPVIELSPFIVKENDDQGYNSKRTIVGSRYSQDLLDLPVSVALINLDQINDLGAATVHDVLRYGVSGVTQNQSFNDDVNIRGFRAGSPLRNGFVRTNTNRPSPLYDIERIEVLKGPAAMLNGVNGGIGGNINYVSRMPTSTPKGEVKISVADTGATRGTINVSGPAIKSSEFNLNYRLTLGALQSDEPRGKSIEWEDQKFFGAGLAMYFGNRSSLLINAYYWINNDYLYLQDFLDISVPVDPRTNLKNAVFNRYSTQNYSSGRKQDAFWPTKNTAIDVTYLASLTPNANLRVAYFYGNNDDRRRNNRGIQVASDNYTLNRQDVRDNTIYTDNFLQMDFVHNLPLKWAKITSMAGAGGETSNRQNEFSLTFMPAADTRTGMPPDDTAWFAQFPNDAAYFLTPRPSSVGLPATRIREITTSFTYYVQEHLELWNGRLLLVGGLRWFSPGGTNHNLVTNVITKRDDASFRVHKYGVVFKPLPSVSLYYTDAQNFFPAAVGRADKFVQNDQLGEPFKPSLGILHELGAKFEYKYSENLNFYGSAAFFKMSQTNIRTFGTLSSGNQGIIQSLEDSADGYEADVGVQIKTSNGRADLIVTYFEGDSAIASDKGLAYVRQAASFVPQKFSFWGKYSVKSGPLRRLRLGAGFETEDEKRNGAFVLEHPLLADAFVGYKLKNNWDLQLNLTNLTNERYIVQVADTGLVQGSDTFRAKLTINYQW